MAVYPFYVESTRTNQSPIKGGVRAKDGEQVTSILQREHGGIITAFQVVQTSHLNENGKRILVARVLNRSGEVVAREETVY